jgi:hypothetical protein
LVIQGSCGLQFFNLNYPGEEDVPDATEHIKLYVRDDVIAELTSWLDRVVTAASASG